MRYTVVVVFSHSSHISNENEFVSFYKGVANESVTRSEISSNFISNWSSDSLFICIE